MTETNQFEPGAVIADRYTIKKKLGHGGMGEVFLVHDSVSGREMALKMLHAKYASSKHAVARFIREVKTARSLRHPGIVKILDAKRWGGTLYYTMEYIDGKSLRRWLQQRERLELGSVTRVLCLVADALEHAHRITIHRDLSPENIMVLRDGSVRLLDFGLAKLDDQFKNLTVVGTNLGKLQYMAPEQQFNAAAVDHRADIFPLGVMFFEMLTGKPPKPGQELTELRPDLPPQAEAFWAKAMAAKAENRFGSAHEFRTALLELYNLSKARPPLPSQAGLWARIRGWIGGLSKR